MGLPKKTAQRVEKYLELFRREHEDVRAEIARMLPEYNELLNMRAVSFEELALQHVAQLQGLDWKDPLFDYSSVVMPCPKCGRETGIKRWTDGTFKCPACKKHYSASATSIAANTKCSASTWLKVFHCLASRFTLEQTTTLCGISSSTYYLMMVKLFYAMSLILEDMKLYGLVEADITYVRSNYRGLDLDVMEYPENSIFAQDAAPPRRKRTRGGSFAAEERNRNSIAIFTAIDDRGHCFVCCTGLGNVTAMRLERSVPPGLFLHTVPETDPFLYMKPISRPPITSAGEETLLVTDCEAALTKFVANAALQHESHVFRRHDHHVRLPKGAHNIQRVNALHSRLKQFLRGLNGISTKYLPGYLTLFTFLECCGQDPKILHRLFSILAQPGLGESPEFYKTLFEIPNIYEQWLSEDNPLKRFSYQQLLAFYLNEVRLKQLADGVAEPMTLAQISEKTGYSCSSVRRIHKELKGAGYTDLIWTFFEESTGNPGHGRTNVKNLLCSDPVMLSLYDAWAKERTLSNDQRRSLNVFVREMGPKYQRNFSYSNVRYCFREIARRGLRPPLPLLSQAPRTLPRCYQRYIAMAVEYDEMKLSYRIQGLPPPPADHLYDVLAQKYGFTQKRVKNAVSAGQSLLKKHPSNP